MTNGVFLRSITNTSNTPIYIQMNNAHGHLYLQEGNSFEFPNDIKISNITIDPAFVHESKTEIKRLKKKCNRLIRKYKK